MKSVITAIYNGETRESMKASSFYTDEEEFACYESLEKSLSNEQRKILDKFISLVEMRAEMRAENQFVKGFCLGMRLASEVNEFFP